MAALFPDFLASDEIYRACQEFWRDLARKAAQSNHQKPDDWARWIPAYKDENGDIELDGNPIFDARSQDLNRGFRAIQRSDHDADFAISAWLTTYPEHASLLPRDELFLDLSLSDATSELATSALTYWMNPETSAEKMQTYIDANFPQRTLD